MAFNLRGLSGTPGTFDVYLLAQSWQAEFCYNKYSTYPGCNSPEDYWTTQFTLHGLWPEYTTGYPESCTDEAFDASSVENAIGLDVLNQYWPNVKANQDDSAYTSFWEHEWTKHGTCSGLSQVDYFTAAINLLKNGQSTTPDVISQNVGGSASADDIRSAYGGANYVALHCKGAFLSEAYTCWGKDDSGNPTTQVQCPDEVINAGNCQDTVSISAFSSS